MTIETTKTVLDPNFFSSVSEKGVVIDMNQFFNERHDPGASTNIVGIEQGSVCDKVAQLTKNDNWPKLASMVVSCIEELKNWCKIDLALIYHGSKILVHDCRPDGKTRLILDKENVEEAIRIERSLGVISLTQPAARSEVKVQFSPGIMGIIPEEHNALGLTTEDHDLIVDLKLPKETVDLLVSKAAQQNVSLSTMVQAVLSSMVAMGKISPHPVLDWELPIKGECQDAINTVATVKKVSREDVLKAAQEHIGKKLEAMLYDFLEAGMRAEGYRYDILEEPGKGEPWKHLRHMVRASTDKS